MLRIDGRHLDLDHLEAFLDDPTARVGLEDEARARVARGRLTIEAILTDGSTAYGVNTGFGKLKNTRIDDTDLQRLQRNLIRSHASGVGEPLADDVVRLMMLLRANALAAGHSGVRTDVIDLILGCLEKDILPIVPCQGSVGASGDLAPLSHAALLLIGEGPAWHRGELTTAKGALAAAGLEALTLEAKEGLALINGTQVSTAIGALALLRARRLLRLADVAAAMTLEALRGSERPFDKRVAALRPHPGHAETSQNMRKILRGSRIVASHRDCDRVQDPYSLRCIPQVHGAVRDAVRHVTEVVERELRAVTDNPLIFPDEGDVISAGNFHAEPVGMVFDYAGIALAEIASISERRVENLVNPDLSGLPPFLAPDSGVNSGMMIAQVTAAALVSENKGLAHPAVVDSIPTSANQEDHVSMAPIAARQFTQITENVSNVVAIEFMAATHALRLREDLRAGDGVEPARRMLEDILPPYDEDRIVATDIAAVREVMDNGRLLEAVLAQTGPLD